MIIASRAQSLITFHETLLNLKNQFKGKQSFSAWSYEDRQEISQQQICFFEFKAGSAVTVENGDHCNPFGSGAACRMRLKRPWTPRNKLAKISAGALYQFSTVRKTSVTDDVIDWPLTNKILDCDTAPWSPSAVALWGITALSWHSYGNQVFTVMLKWLQFVGKLTWVCFHFILFILSSLFHLSFLAACNFFQQAVETQRRMLSTVGLHQWLYNVTIRKSAPWT